MMTLKSAALALTTVLCAASFAGAADARGPLAGHMGSHMGGHMGGHMGHVAHIGHGGHGHWGHHHGWYGPGFGVGIYDPYYSSYYDDDDCYRVYRHHRWLTVCD